MKDFPESFRFNIPRDWMEDARWILGIFVVWKIFLSIGAALVAPNGIGLPDEQWQGGRIYDTFRLAQPSSETWTHYLLDPWFRWDAVEYLKISTQGYSSTDGSIVFPPPYPLLIRLTTPLLGGNALLSALVVSNLCLVVALFGLLRYLRREFPPNVLRLGVMALVMFPTGIFFFTAYTESVCLLWIIATLWATNDVGYGPVSLDSWRQGHAFML
jgi:hypothetical protein